MNDQLQKFTSPQGTAIDVQVVDNEPWFRTKDTCGALEISPEHVSQARQSIPDYNQRQLSVKNPSPVGSNTIDVWFVNEPGLYQLIFKSQKDEAKAFQRWVTEEVLPQIRKTGSYTMGTKNLGKFVVQCQGLGVTCFVTEDNVYAQFPELRNALSYYRNVYTSLRRDLESFLHKGKEVDSELPNHELWIDQEGMYLWAQRTQKAHPLLQGFFQEMHEQVYQRRFESVVRSSTSTQALTRQDVDTDSLADTIAEKMEARLMRNFDEAPPQKFAHWNGSEFVAYVEENFSRVPADFSEWSLWDALYFRMTYYYDVPTNEYTTAAETSPGIQDFKNWMHKLPYEFQKLTAEASEQLVKEMPSV